MKRLLIVLGLGALASGVGADILWDQCTGYQALLGCNAQDFEEVYDCYDCWAGDDFQVSDEPGWIVRDVHWIPYFGYGSAVVNHVNFYIMKTRDDGYGDWDAVVWHESGFYGERLYAGEQYEYVLSEPLILYYRETYFFVVQVDMPFATQGKHTAAWTYADIYGVGAAMINPNGCFGSGTDWFAPDDGYEMCFKITGEIIPEPGLVSLAGLLLGAAGLWLRRR